jgi:hypothetical protein
MPPLSFVGKFLGGKLADEIREGFGHFRRVCVAIS